MNTLTTCATYRRSEVNAITHWRNSSFHHAAANFIWRCTTFLQISMHPHPDCRWQFLLLIHIPIQDHTQQMEVFNLDIPHGNFSACYNIQNKYLGITFDETSTVEISEDHFKTFQKANRQVSYWTHHFYHLPNPPTSALYAKTQGLYPEKMFPIDQEGQQH